MLQAAKKNKRLLIRKKALQYLARREHTRSQLEKKLLRHGELGEVGSVLDELESDDFLSVSRYLESCIRSYVRKLYGPEYIMLKLCQQGFDERVIEQGLRAAKIDWPARARCFCLKKFPSLEAMDEQQRRQCVRSLRRRGYHDDTIETLIKVSHEDWID